MLTLNASLQTQLNAMHQALAGKRTFVEWLRDVGGNLIVNVVTILVIGAAVLGYNTFGKVQQQTEKEVGLGASEAASAASLSPDAAKR